MRDTYPQPGHRLNNRYEIKREIGRGGYSIVYEAWDHVLKQSVAIKLIAPPPATVHNLRERTRREVTAVRQLKSPHIIKIYDLLETEEWLFIVMELCRGGDLESRTQKNGPLSNELLTQVAVQVGSALAEAHQSGILHRDVKPKNILFDENNNAYLTDFGSARIQGQETITATGAWVGTLDYVGPEVLSGQRPDGRSDLYSLGLTLFYAAKSTLPDKPSLHLPPTPKRNGFKIPEQSYSPALIEGISRITHADPADRYPTAKVFVQNLAHPNSAVCDSNETKGFTLEKCLVCGKENPLSLLLCPNCERNDLASEGNLVYVGVPDGHPSLELWKKWILANTSEQLSSANLNEVLKGKRALLLCSSTTLSELKLRLGEMNFPFKVAAYRDSWSLLPSKFQLFFAVNAGLGLAAGWNPLNIPLIVATLGYSLFIFTLAVREMRKVAISGIKTKSSLPNNTVRMILELSHEVERGSTRNLFYDLIRTLKEIGKHENSTSLALSLPSLAETICHCVQELNAVEKSLKRLNEYRKLKGETGDRWEKWGENLIKLEFTRDTLVQKLLELLVSLSTLSGENSTSATALCSELDTLQATLNLELQAQAQAEQEMRELLAA